MNQVIGASEMKKKLAPCRGVVIAILIFQMLAAFVTKPIYSVPESRVLLNLD